MDFAERLNSWLGGRLIRSLGASREYGMFMICFNRCQAVRGLCVCFASRRAAMDMDMPAAGFVEDAGRAELQLRIVAAHP